MKQFLTFGIMLLFIGMAFTPTTGFYLDEQFNLINLNRGTLYVGGTSSGNYSTIQEAINNASDGDTVFVYDDSSPYYENVVVDKSINLIGEERDTTIIDGNLSGDVVYISADWVNISGFTIRNSGYPHCGISISSNYNNITGNNISNNYDGIYLYESSSNTITDNNISNNGIYLSYSSNNTITCNNIISNYRNGIYIRYSSNNNNITDNNISTNNRQGISLDSSSNNNIMGNNISNNLRGINLLEEGSNNTITGNNISNNRYGIGLYSSGNTVTGNNISNNRDGIYLYETSGNTVTGNNISNNRYGINLREFSSNNIITGNNISNNERGISLDSSGNTVTGNNISNNEYGIRIYSSSGSTVTGNNISNNDYGIYIRYSSSNNITGNNISNNYNGIYLLHYSSNNNTITGNTISNNKNGIYLESSGSNNIISYNSFFNDSLYVYDSYQNTVFNNTVNGKPLVYLEDESDIVIDDAGQVILIKCDNITVQNLELSTSIGIWLWDTNNCLFSGNTISSGLFLISSSNNNNITGNNISNNEYGIRIYSSSGNTVKDNNISNNKWGIRLFDSSGNISNNYIYNNYFNNINNVYDGGNNTWNISKTLGTNIIGGPYLGGNYWSDYTGVDLDGDGLGDTGLPYNSSGNIHNGGDWLPLVNSLPYTPSNPYPPDGATDIDINSDLSWDGGDPDSGDTVTYDVYFGTTSLPPKVFSNQSETTYDPTMSFNTHYYWKIVAWDNHGASSEGPIWDFTTIDGPEPDLDCDGSLSWNDVEPGSTVEGSFTVENIGEPESLLDWEVSDYPSWGDWTFSPSNGTGLTPEDGEFNVGVTVIAPNEQNTEFSGTITIVNIDNSSDYCTIDVSLATPKNQNMQFGWLENFPILNKIFNRFMEKLNL